MFPESFAYPEVQNRINCRLVKRAPPRILANDDGKSDINLLQLSNVEKFLEIEAIACEIDRLNER